MAENAGTTYGVDHSSENHYGQGPSFRSPTERFNNATAAAASTPTVSVWLIGGLILAALVWL